MMDVLCFSTTEFLHPGWNQPVMNHLRPVGQVRSLYSLGKRCPSSDKLKALNSQGHVWFWSWETMAADGRNLVDNQHCPNTEDTASKTSFPSWPERVCFAWSPLISSDRLHYKERLVELINHCHADPAVLFSLAEMTAELQRWHVAVPTREPDEPDVLYSHRLRLVCHTILTLRQMNYPKWQQSELFHLKSPPWDHIPCTYWCNKQNECLVT